MRKFVFRSINIFKIAFEFYKLFWKNWNREVFFSLNIFHLAFLFVDFFPWKLLFFSLKNSNFHKEKQKSKKVKSSQTMRGRNENFPQRMFMGEGRRCFKGKSKTKKIRTPVKKDKQKSIKRTLRLKFSLNGFATSHGKTWRKSQKHGKVFSLTLSSFIVFLLLTVLQINEKENLNLKDFFDKKFSFCSRRYR